MNDQGTTSRGLAVPHGTSSVTPRESSPPVLIPRESLRTAFQPIVSIRTGAAWGVEALTRAVDPVSGQVMAPLRLFLEAERTGVLSGFDRYCRREAIETFHAHATDSDLLLSLNWDVRTLGTAIADPSQFLRVVERVGLEPSRVVIEVLEGRAENLDELARFVEDRRAEGFLVAVDDYGTGHSTAERLVRLEPDIVKIDRALVNGAATSVSRRETCRTIAELAKSIGAVVIAEGVERDADLLELAMMGIDLVQGFLLARPDFGLAEVVGQAEAAITDRRALLRARAEDEVTRRRTIRRLLETTFERVIDRVRLATGPSLEQSTAAIVESTSGVEAIYVLDPRGIQLTSTHVARDASRKSGFRATGRGTDLALKDYFLEVAFGDGVFTSRPYVSMASGKVCVTHARRLRISDGSTVIVCCDVPEPPVA